MSAAAATSDISTKCVCTRWSAVRCRRQDVAKAHLCRRHKNTLVRLTPRLNAMEHVGGVHGVQRLRRMSLRQTNQLQGSEASCNRRRKADQLRCPVPLLLLVCMLSVPTMSLAQQPSRPAPASEELSMDSQLVICLSQTTTSIPAPRCVRSTGRIWTFNLLRTKRSSDKSPSGAKTHFCK